MNGPAKRLAADGEVPSPCVSICTMDAAGVLCLGCFRTLDEIAAWSVLDGDAKRAVLAALASRRAASTNAQDAVNDPRDRAVDNPIAHAPERQGNASTR